MRKGLRFPIFWKILLSCLSLAGLMIALSYAYSRYREGMTPGRGKYLKKHFQRFVDYMEGVGQSVGSVAEVLAEDGPLVEALANGKKDEANAVSARMFKALSRKNAIQPAIFLVFDRAGNAVFISEGSGVQPTDLREMEAVGKVRTGTAYFSKLLLHANKVYQVTGVPIRGPGGADLVGGLVIAVPIERYFLAYKAQSDDVEKKQHRLTLIRDDVVIASVYSQERSGWAELAAAVKPENWQYAKDGKDTISILSYKESTWDFYTPDEPVRGFVGPDQDVLGRIYIMRTRDQIKAPAGYLFAMVSGIGLAIVVALLLAMWITRPVKAFTRATREIADGGGDLTKRIEMPSNDELGDLADNINKLFDNLHRLAQGVQGASFQVGTSSAEISAASKQMLEGVKDQAVKIEGSTAAVTELSTSIQQVASNAIEATKAAHQSNESVAQAIESMNHIRKTVEDAADKIHELGESGKRIGNIVEVIRQISEQTSLLALNASIEAAHAGEQGRGFAVVADEVSSLARRVGQSAKDIEDLIATIKDQTSDAVSTMQSGTKEVESGTGLVVSTLANLKQIIEVIQDTASSVQEQAIVSDEIARNMDAVQKIAGEVLSSSEEAVIQGEQLHQLAHRLEESVRGFNLGHDGDDGGIEPPRRRALPPVREDAEPSSASGNGGDGERPRTAPARPPSSRAALGTRPRPQKPAR